MKQVQFTEPLIKLLKPEQDNLMNLMKIVILAIMSLFLSSCTLGNRVSYDGKNRPIKQLDQIEVLDMNDIQKKYKVIGLVSSRSAYMHSALKSCRKEAALLGADAIINFGPDGGGGMGVVTGSGVIVTANMSYSAKAIAWE